MADFTEEILINTEVKGSDKAEKQLDGLADATNKADEAGQEYEKTLGEMAGEVEVFGVSLNGLIGGFKNSLGAISNSVKSLKSFKVALASTGIGLLVIALGSLVAWLKSSQEGLNIINDSLAVVGATINGLLGLLSKLGSALIKVFKGDFKGAIEEAKGALSGFVSGIESAVTRTLNLEKALRKLQILQGNSNVLIAVANQEIAKNKRGIEDVNASTLSRIKLAERNLELVQKNGEEQEKIALLELEAERERVNIANEQAGRTDTLIADQLILRNLEANVIATKTEQFEKEIEFANKLNEFRAVYAEEEHRRRMDAQVDIETERILTNTAVSEEVDMKQAGLDAMKASVKNYYAYVEEKREDDFELAETQARLELSLVSDLYGALAGLAGQDSELGKALAVAQAGINTYLGVTSVLARPIPLAQKILEIAIVTATGLKAVQDIKGTPLPKVTIADTPFASGGIIGGELHSAGGTWINAERGEGIINRKSMSIPWVKKQASYLNTIGGGIPFMARGGVVPSSSPSPFLNMERALAQSRNVLVLDDLDRAQQGELVTKVTTTL